MLNALAKILPKLTVAVACTTLLAQTPSFAADADQGKAIAERWCASCHVVGKGQTGAPTDQAPPFASLAARPGFGAERLALLLLVPHPNMPKLSLNRFEVTDLAEYILTLK
jgi:mono/diheme cytochrome c family protein